MDAPGAVLAGVLFSAPEPELVVSVNAATGVPAQFYHGFARWLAGERRAAVLCWDYRDFGASGSPYGAPATMTDWAVTDPLAVRRALEARFPDLPLWVIGHSLGGMGVGFQPGIERVARIITVASGHGHLSAHPWPFRAKAWGLWYGFGPLLTVLARDHFPGARLGMGSDLPSGVYWQWRRWLVTRGGLPADPGLGGLKTPGYGGEMVIVAMADDTMMPPACVWKMAAWHPRARVTQRLLEPAAFGLPGLGHVHPFAARNAACWPAIIA